MPNSVQKVLLKERLLKKFWSKGKEYHAQSDSFISKYKDKIIVIKYGGYALTKSQLVKSFAKNITLLNKVGIKVIIVHGGGPQIEKELRKRKIQDREYQGLRITTKKILSIVKNILARKLNKMILSEIKKCGGNAKSINGINIKIIKAKFIMGGKLGFVGEPTKLDKKYLNQLLSKGIIPIISPLGYDSNKNSYNINADTAAGFIAENLKAQRLLLLTDVAGVLDKDRKLIAELNHKKAFEYIRKGTIKGGMIPKIKACFSTLRRGARGVALIDGRKPDAVLMELLTKKGAGTLIKRK
tara:strand:- start:931 stop:1824 length:894 start_codon:yes stop_codon:yes gene_type:complete